MSENRRLFKHFQTPDFETQVLDIVKKNIISEPQNNVAKAPPEELIIEVKDVVESVLPTPPPVAIIEPAPTKLEGKKKQNKPKTKKPKK